MQTLLACTESSRAGLTMFARDGFARMRGARAVALFAAHVPLRHGLGLDVVVHRMAAVAQRAGGALHVVVGIKSRPPVGAGRGLIGPPDLMRDVPLRAERIVIVALLREIALLPLAAVDEGDVVLREFHQRIGLGEVGKDRVGMRLRIAHHVRHAGLAPAVVYRRMARLAGRGSGIALGTLGQHGPRNNHQQDNHPHHCFKCICSIILVRRRKASQAIGRRSNSASRTRLR